MTDRSCSHGMPSPASCIECMEDGPVMAPERAAEEVEARFPARFDGHCNACNLPISVGQRIAKLSSGRYVHEGCV